MPTYESSGSLTTVEKSYSTPQTPDLTGLVYTLNGETITVDVVGSPGEAGEETVTQSLGGATSYDLTWSNAHTDFEVVFSLSTGDTSVTPEVDDLTLTGGPNAPTNLTVTEVTDTPDVSLSWVDNASTEDEYRVYRATSPGTVVGDYTLVDTLAADTTIYTDTTVSLGTRYYYVVTAASGGGESPVSNEVRAEPNADDFTESISWDTETEWGYGLFMPGTKPTGSGGVEMDLSGSQTFTYEIFADEGSTNTASVQIIDDDTSNQLRFDSQSGNTGNSPISGEWTIDTETHPNLRLEATAESNATGDEAYATITDEAGMGASATSTDTEGTVTDTYTDFYGVQTGTYETETWDYTNTTTASKLTTTSTFNDASEDITVTVTVPGGATSQHTLSGGSEEFVVNVAASDRYYLDVAFDAGNDASDGPVLESATLEAHTPPSTLQITSTDATSNQLSWTGWGAADEYELYRSESTPVTTNDTLLTTTTSTTYTDSSLENGEAYYYNVRAEYTGE